ncbi:unknown [Candidatus Colimorpha enterica]|uniref:Uncharacterized protein n=1 Tax=Candidatus Colimorpha enterica TaxID=3083063 RepID=R6TPM4_9BACT|nr:unknown [Candidatus Colimorpha enterica]
MAETDDTLPLSADSMKEYRSFQISLSVDAVSESEAYT